MLQFVFKKVICIKFWEEKTIFKYGMPTTREQGWQFFVEPKPKILKLDHPDQKNATYSYCTKCVEIWSHYNNSSSTNAIHSKYTVPRKQHILSTLDIWTPHLFSVFNFSRRREYKKIARIPLGISIDLLKNWSYDYI